MALRDKLAKRMEAHLEPGERIQSVFMAQAGPSPYWMFLTYLMFFWFRPVIIAVTDRAVVIVNTGKLRTTFPKKLHLRGARQVQLGPVSGLWGSVQLDETYYVHKRFHKDVHAADAALQQMHQMPPLPQGRPLR